MTAKSAINQGEHQPVGLPGDCPNTYLTLSAVGEVERQHDRSVAELDAMLAELRAAATEAEHTAAVDALIDTVWGPFAPPAENELRALWGDR